MNLKEINITSKKDWESLEEKWNNYFSNEIPFSPYKQLLSKLNIIVGFGRGFWSGVHGYFYLVYHKEKDRFYWYLRDIESDDNVHFYEVDENEPIFDLLKTTPIEKNFKEFDAALDFSTLYRMSIGDTNELPENVKPASLVELFGEDTEQLRIALMYFYPGNHGSRYPHREFHQRFFKPFYEKKLDEAIQTFNQNPNPIYRKESDLFLDFNGDTYQLVKVKK